MEQYFRGVIPQLEERVDKLISSIPRGLGREVDALVFLCRERLGKAKADLRLVVSPEFARVGTEAIRLRRYRRVVGELDLIERIPIAVLMRWNEADRAMNAFAERACVEMAYTISAPVVSCLSFNKYFHSYPAFNLVCVPPAEGRFLLQLPDLYHELGHLLLDTENDEQVRPLQMACAGCFVEWTTALSNDLQQERRRRSPQAFSVYLEQWLASVKVWTTELVCDVFATLTVGPSYVWSHLHLCTSRGRDPFEVFLGRVGTAHPADAVRTAVMFAALRELGLGEDAARIEAKWNEVIVTLGASQSPEFRRCYPTKLPTEFAKRVSTALQDMKFVLFRDGDCGQVRGLLNDAWKKFWRAPDEYARWERDACA